MIALENVTIRAGAFVLEGASLHVAAGQYAVLMGRTGSGKTSLLEAICGLRRVAAGRVHLMGRDVTDEPVSARGIGYVPQDRALFSTMTVDEHLAFALVVRHRPRPEIAARVDELAELLGIRYLLGRGVRNLSGGEQQRVALGRALAAHPGILLLDEPLSALDEQTRTGMCDLLAAVRRRTGVTVLHVTHNRAEAAALADRLFVIENGAVREADPAGTPVMAELADEGE